MALAISFRKHKGIKISTYCDDNRFIYLPVISKANIHDIKLLEPTLDINVKPICLVGDKGYISSEIKTKLKNNGTELVYPYRKERLRSLPLRGILQELQQKQ